MDPKKDMSFEDLLNEFENLKENEKVPFLQKMQKVYKFPSRADPEESTAVPCEVHRNVHLSMQVFRSIQKAIYVLAKGFETLNPEERPKQLEPLINLLLDLLE